MISILHDNWEQRRLIQTYHELFIVTSFHLGREKTHWPSKEAGINCLVVKQSGYLLSPKYSKAHLHRLKLINDVHRASRETIQVERSPITQCLLSYICIQEFKIIVSIIVPKILMLNQVLDGKFKMRIQIVPSLKSCFYLSRRYNII